MTDARQRYISKELIHFVGRGKPAQDQFELLLKIISSGCILHPPFNPGISGNLNIRSGSKFSENEMYAPEITCFADIPVSDLSIHMGKYSLFGISFCKDFIAQAGGAPVHYVPKIASVYEAGTKAAYFDKITTLCNQLFSEIRFNRQNYPADFLKKLGELERFLDFHIFSYVKFFDHLLDDDDIDNYYFEREWRIIGNLNFKIQDIKTVFLPSSFSYAFRYFCPDYCGQAIFTD